MGLDMYFSSKIYIGADYEHRDVTGIIDIKIQGRPVDIDLSKVSSIILHEGYFRKFNALHGWLVENIQGGIDNCQDSYFPEEKQEELMTICEKILEAKSDEISQSLLPTTTGFFFGNQEYDEYYYNNVQELLDLLNRWKKEDKIIYYAASW